TFAGADLTQLGLRQEVVDRLVNFRNPDATGASVYQNAVQAFAGNGFLTTTSTASTGVAFTSNAFVNRQDLLKYVRTQNSELTAALPYLTTYSRSVNAPSWTPPSTPANTNPKIPDVRFLGTGNITHYRDDGTTEPAYAVKPGDPLVQR